MIMNKSGQNPSPAVTASLSTRALWIPFSQETECFSSASHTLVALVPNMRKV